MTSPPSAASTRTTRELAAVALPVLAPAAVAGAFAAADAVAHVLFVSSALGAAVLAARGGAGRAGAALAGLGFACASSAAAPGGWLDPLAHLPWVLVVVDAFARRPGPASLALLLVSQVLLFGAARPEQRDALALAVMGTLLVGAGRGRGRLAALALGALAGVAVSPPGPGAWWPSGPRRPFDPLDLGLTLACAGALGVAALGPAASRRFPRAADLALAAALLALAAAARRGFDLGPALSSRPGAVAPVALPLLAFALAGLLSGGRDARAWIGLGGWAIAVGLPGARALWEHLPFVGRVDPASFAAAAALLLGLSAASALETAPPRARGRAAIAVAAGIGLALLAPRPALGIELDLPDELVRWELDPRPARAGAPLATGSVDVGLPVERVRALLLATGGRSAPLECPVELAELPADDGAHETRAFRVLHTEQSATLAPGHWLVALSFERSGPDGERELLGIRRIAALDVPRRGCTRAALSGLAALTLLALLLPGARLRAGLAAALTLAYALAGAWCSGP